MLQKLQGVALSSGKGRFKEWDGSRENFSKRRLVFLDELRGFAIVCMVAYHFVFDLVSAKIVFLPFFDSGPMNAVRDVFAGLFIFISGISCLLSRDNLRRGAFCMGAALLVTGVTALYAPDMPVRFGILHLLGVSMILYGLLDPVLARIKPVWGFLLCAALFLLTLGVKRGVVGIPVLLEVPVPQIFYQTELFLPFGVLPKGFVSADYFPLFPWVFCFLSGCFFARWFRHRGIPLWLYDTHIGFLAQIGRYTLWIYLLHQPVFFLLFKLFGMFLWE